MRTVYFLFLVSAFVLGGCAGGKSSTHETNETSTHTPNPGDNAHEAIWRKLRAILSGDSDEHISSEELNSLEDISGAETGRDYTTALKLAHYADRNNPTSAEIQAVIDAVNINHPPRISGKPAEAVQAEHTYTFTPHADDDDNDTLHFSLLQKPDWLSISPSNGTVKGTPPPSEIGQQATVIVQVDDGKEIASLSPFTITVKQNNHKPSLSGTPSKNVDADQLYVFTPVAHDPDGDTLVFSITNQPEWTDFSPATGELRGTPHNANARTYSNIILSAYDGTDTVSLPPFDITVMHVNHPPSISGTPPTVLDVNASYSFRPNASDPDGDQLSFQIENKPDWLECNTSNGHLSGTPNSTGIAKNIILSVTDGNSTQELPPFSLTVKIPVISCGDTNTTRVSPGAHIHPLSHGTRIRLRHLPDGSRTACVIKGDAGIILNEE